MTSWHEYIAIVTLKGEFEMYNDDICYNNTRTLVYSSFNVQKLHHIQNTYELWILTRDGKLFQVLEGDEIELLFVKDNVIDMWEIILYVFKVEFDIMLPRELDTRII